MLHRRACAGYPASSRFLRQSHLLEFRAGSFGHLARHARTADAFPRVSGYGTPNLGPVVHQLRKGYPATTRQLKSQRNTGFDIGGDWTPVKKVKVSLTGFYEWYQNEQLIDGGHRRHGLQPTPSTRRAPCIAAWKPRSTGSPSKDGGCSPITPTTIRYSRLHRTARHSGGALGYFNRAGYRIPGVAPHELTARVGYDQPFGQSRASEPMSNISTKAPITSTMAMC